MKKLFLTLILVCCALALNAQNNTMITTFEHIEVLNNNVDEAKYYYQNNWKVLRELALEKNYIDSFDLLYSEEGRIPHFILLTNYSNKEQFDTREAHFSELIASLNGLNLLNEKQPNEFRKSVFGSEALSHI